jgi:Zn-finger nucleic acid-binding protein
MADATQAVQGTMGLTCPKCAGSMRAYERSGITIDQCTECRGVFLDRGELERLIDTEDVHYGGSGGGRREQAGSRDELDMEQDDPREHGSRGGQRKRRGGFLGDLLDFG